MAKLALELPSDLKLDPGLISSYTKLTGSDVGGYQLCRKHGLQLEIQRHLTKLEQTGKVNGKLIEDLYHKYKTAEVQDKARIVDLLLEMFMRSEGKDLAHKEWWQLWLSILNSENRRVGLKQK